jgi:peptide/nickel transport system substrate-binding protein
VIDATPAAVASRRAREETGLMMSRAARSVAPVVCALLALGAAGCGTASNPHTPNASASAPAPSLPLKAGENPAGQQLYGKRRGGVLTAYTASDFENLDPGESYFQGDYAIDYPTQRPLFAYLPNTAQTVSADLATEVPTIANGGITDGGRTLTVHIRRGVHFSPPVDREVTSADVAYAIERGANPNVANPYFAIYFGAGAPAPLVGAQSPNYKGGPIPGIQTPNRYTIVFHTTKPSGSFLVQALTMPLSAPVPVQFAKPLDAHGPTLYGSEYLVATGPYMIKADPKTGKFNGIGYQTGKSLTLVRNPNWNPSTDYRPAYLNEIRIEIGGEPTVIGAEVLKGSDAVQLDTPAQASVKLAYLSYPSQITFTPGAGDHYAAIDNAAGPFRNEDLRRALWAAVDREAIVKARGGPLVDTPMTHFIYPGVEGFEQAGGYAGPQVDYNSDVDGNLSVARKYMRLAGYPSGRYTGDATIQLVGSTDGNAPAIAQIFESALASLGFHVHATLVDQSVMYAKYCGVPKQNIDVCPSMGWMRDFADPLTVVYAPFYGPAIQPTNNSNMSQTNDPQINAAMARAALVSDPTARAAAWAGVDRLLVEKAVAIPEVFDNQPDIESRDVAGVDALWNTGTWDFDFTSLR